MLATIDFIRGCQLGSLHSEIHKMMMTVYRNPAHDLDEDGTLFPATQELFSFVS
jgi:hypothetical protein